MNISDTVDKVVSILHECQSYDKTLDVRVFDQIRFKKELFELLNVSNNGS